MISQQIQNYFKVWFLQPYKYLFEWLSGKRLWRPTIHLTSTTGFLSNFCCCCWPIKAKLLQPSSHPPTKFSWPCFPLPLTLELNSSHLFFSDSFSSSSCLSRWAFFWDFFRLYSRCSAIKSFLEQHKWSLLRFPDQMQLNSSFAGAAGWRV